LPTDRTYQAFFDAAYAPEIQRGADGRLPWYGEPAFGVTLSLVDVEQFDVPRDFAGDKVNTLSGAATLSLGASHDGWSWNLAHTVSLFKDKTGVLSDTLDDLTDVSAEIALGDRLALSPFVQWSTLKDMDLGYRTNSFNLGLGAKVVLIPDVLAGNVAYTFDLQTGPGDTPDTHIVEGELLWTLVPASVNRPGLAVAFSGNLQRRVDDIDDGLPDTAFEVFTKLRLSLPAAY